MPVSREQLFQEVWAEPLLKVAPRYNVSGNFLARVCATLNIPTPGRGYWAKVAAGQKPRRATLPPPRAGDDLEWCRFGEPSTVPQALPTAPDQSSDPGIAAAAHRKPRNGLHPILVGAAETFLRGHTSHEGYCRPYKKHLVDLFVSTDVLPTAIKTASMIYNALEARGYRVLLYSSGRLGNARSDLDERENPGGRRWEWKTWAPERATVAFVGSIPFGLTLYEMSRPEEVTREDALSRGPFVKKSKLVREDGKHYYFETRDMPSGRLCLHVFSADGRASWDYRWSESKRGELRGKLDEIVLHLEREAPKLAQLIAAGEQRRREEHERWEAKRREDDRREAERRRVEAIKASREELFKIVDAWGIAKQIEGFFEDAERRTANLGETERAVIADRLVRARRLLGGVDALERFRAWAAPEER